MSVGKPAALVVHGWTIFAHPSFLDQLQALAQQVEGLKKKEPLGYAKKKAENDGRRSANWRSMSSRRTRADPNTVRAAPWAMRTSTGFGPSSSSSTPAVFPVSRTGQDDRAGLGQ